MASKFFLIGPWIPVSLLALWAAPQDWNLSTSLSFILFHSMKISKSYLPNGLAALDS